VADSAVSTETETGLPRYTGPRGSTDLWAEFPSGVAVPVARGRGRAYPGLPSAAPSTVAFYRAFAAATPSRGVVLDVGCGAGSGTRELLAHFDAVKAVDRDPKALAFVRERLPRVSLVQSAFDGPLDGDPADSAILADVLGHVVDPVRFLGAVRGSLKARARVLVAEPSAFVAQRLERPVRRAFSKQSLSALLVRSGFHATTWVVDNGTFIACVATASDDGAWEAFAAAKRLAAKDLQAALAELGRAARSGRRDVQREAALSEAELRFARGDGDGAARAFLAAARLDPGDPRPLAGLSELAGATGSLGDAMDLALRATELDPTDKAAVTALAAAADRSSHPDVFRAYRIAERLSPDDLFIATRLAGLASERGDYAFGISVFERLRAYGDTLPVEFHVTLALMLAAEGRRADALLELKYARTLAPNDETVLALQAEFAADEASGAHARPLASSGEGR
jgi:tetratricopeptide (TPR) repeat protein